MDRAAAACVGSVGLHVVAWIVLAGIPDAERHLVASAPLVIDVRDVREVKEAPPAPAPAEKAAAPAVSRRKASRPKAVAPRAEVPVPAPEMRADDIESDAIDGDAKKGEVLGGPGIGGQGTGGDGTGGHGIGGDGTGDSAVVLHPHVEPKPSENYTRLVPPYSDASIDSDVNGAVSLRLEIDENGQVVKATVLKPLGHGLDQIAIETAKKYRFAPARDESGKPVRTRIGWNIVWESYWKRLVVETVSGHPNCLGHGPMNLGEVHPEYMDCDHPAGAFDLSADDLSRP